MFQGGDTIEVAVSHSVLGNYNFSVPSDEDATVDLGGYKSEISVTGNLQVIDTMTAKAWRYELPVCWDMLSNDTLDFLQKLQESPVHGDFTFTNINGSIYAGKGKPVGDLAGSTKDSKINATFSGGGRLAKI